MPKIVTKIPKGFNYYYKKFFLLIIKVKNFIILIVLFHLLKTSFEDKHKKMFSPSKNFNHRNDIKVCICTLGKNENRYIKEFIDHYKEIGVDKIFLHDNNEIEPTNESFETQISEYIKNGFVEIINYRGRKYPQFEIYSECFKKNHKNYNWLMIFDVDEFIHLDDYSNIKDFLNEERFNKCKLIYFNCLRHTDNDLLFYDNRPLSERFPKINWKSRSFTLKTIARSNIQKIRFTTSHWLDRRIIGCNVFGEAVIPSKLVKLKNDINQPKFKRYYIDHYCFKSTEEFINKINRGDGIFGFNNRTRMHKIKLYFEYNKITLEKINYLEQKTGLNLSEYRLKLYKSNLLLNTNFPLSNKILILYIILIINFAILLCLE